MDEVERELLAEIASSPSDAAPRSVYADWLIEHNDPRGELIALQLGRRPGEPRTPRERQLFADHAAKWVAALPIDLQLPHPCLLHQRMTGGFAAHPVAVLVSDMPEPGSDLEASLLRYSPRYVVLHDKPSHDYVYEHWRGRLRDANGWDAPVLVKLPFSRLSAAENEVATLINNELAILSFIGGVGAPKPRGYARMGARCALVADWIDHETFSQVGRRIERSGARWPVALIAAIAAQLFTVLAEIQRVLARHLSFPVAVCNQSFDRSVALGADGRVILLDFSHLPSGKADKPLHWLERASIGGSVPSIRVCHDLTRQEVLGTRGTLDPATDVWRASLALFRLATGESIFSGADFALISAIVDWQGQDQRLKRLGRFGDVLARGLDPDPANRATLREMANAMQQMALSPAMARSEIARQIARLPALAV